MDGFFLKMAGAGVLGGLVAFLFFPKKGESNKTTNINIEKNTPLNTSDPVVNQIDQIRYQRQYLLEGTPVLTPNFFPLFGFVNISQGPNTYSKTTVINNTVEVPVTPPPPPPPPTPQKQKQFVIEGPYSGGLVTFSGYR